MSPLLAEEGPSRPLASNTIVQFLDKQKESETDNLSLDEQIQNTKKKLSSLAKDNSAVLDEYEQMVAILVKAYKEEKSMKEEQVKHVLNALLYAAECHQSQTRKNMAHTPYIIHPMSVTQNLLSIGHVRDTDVIIASLLHDTIEDTQATYDDLKKRFGEKVEGLVREVTEDNKLAGQKKRKMQIVHALQTSKEASMIKLADKLYNLEALITEPPEKWTRERIDQYFEWSQVVIDNLPDANPDLKAAVHKVILDYWQKQS